MHARSSCGKSAEQGEEARIPRFCAERKEGG